MDGHTQLYDIIAAVLGQIGPASLSITTFSTSEEFLRRIHHLRQQGLITHARLVTDLKASHKTAILFPFMKQMFDEVYLAQNHSKVVLFDAVDGHHVSVITSQNQTRGNRFESGIITTDKSVFYSLSIQLQLLINNAFRLNDLR